MAVTGTRPLCYFCDTEAERPAASTVVPGALAGCDDTSKAYINRNGSWIELAGGASAVADGDYGDITVSGSGSVWTIDNDAVTYAKIQNVTDNRLLGRSAGSSGDMQEITLAS